MCELLLSRAEKVLLPPIQSEINMSVSEKIINVLRNVSGSFNDDTELNVSELVHAGECGVALEILCFQLLEYEIPISKADKSLLIDSAEQMNMLISEISEISEIKM